MSRTARLVKLLRQFELDSSATPMELRKAYYKQAKLWHPDIAGAGAADQFKRLQESYHEAMEHLREMDERNSHVRGGPAPGFGSAPGKEESTNWSTGSHQRTWDPTYQKVNFGKVNFDFRKFREGNRSHTFRGQGNAYTYDTGGSGPSSSFYSRTQNGRGRPTPAQVFRWAVAACGGLLALTSIPAPTTGSGRRAVGPHIYAENVCGEAGPAATAAYQ